MDNTYAKRKPVPEASAKAASAPEREQTIAPVSSLRASAEIGNASRIDLSDTIRAKMEHAFGMDLDTVRLYESEAVAEHGAEAVTQGDTIAFAPGKHDFAGRSGQELLGHELSHVAGRRRGEVTGSGFLNSPALEARADREGALAAAGGQIYGGPVTGPFSDASAGAAVAGPIQASKKKSKKAPAKTGAVPAAAPVPPLKPAGSAGGTHAWKPGAVPSSAPKMPLLLSGSAGGTHAWKPGAVPSSAPKMPLLLSGSAGGLTRSRKPGAVAAAAPAPPLEITMDEGGTHLGAPDEAAAEAPAPAGETYSEPKPPWIDSYGHIVDEEASLEHHRRRTAHMYNIDNPFNSDMYWKVIAEMGQEPPVRPEDLLSEEGIRFQTPEEAYQFFGVGTGGEYDKWEKGFQDEQGKNTGQERAFAAYSMDPMMYNALTRNEIGPYGEGGTYQEINSALRGSRGDDRKYSQEMKKQIGAMDAALDRFDLQKPIVVHRISGAEMLGGLTDPTDIEDIFKGRVIRDPGFISTSVLDKSDFQGTIHCIITIPAGKGRGAFISPISVFGERESEFLLKRNTAFVVKKAYKEGDRTAVEMQVV